jgi:hypothetical protein
MSIPTFKKLREATDEELISSIPPTGTHVSGVGSEAVEAQIILNELARRDQEKQTKTIERYTKWMTLMTAIITVMTAIILVLTIILVRVH